MSNASRNVVFDVISDISNDMTRCIDKNDAITTCPETVKPEVIIGIDNLSVGSDGSAHIQPNIVDDDLHTGTDSHDTSRSPRSSIRRFRDKKMRASRRDPYVHETSDDLNRPELLWNSKIEGIIKVWYEKCLNYSELHNLRSARHKKIFYSISIPSAIIPMVLASAGEGLGASWKPVVICCLILTGILNIINGFLNPGKRAEEHLNFEALYSELAIEITSELVKPQRYRQDADVFIQRIMDRYTSLNNRAPKFN